MKIYRTPFSWIVVPIKDTSDLRFADINEDALDILTTPVNGRLIAFGFEKTTTEFGKQPYWTVTVRLLSEIPTVINLICSFHKEVS
jgi:hypothetical protein